MRPVRRNEFQGHGGFWLLALGAVLFVYVLSFGPAVRWHGHYSPQIGEVVEAVYAPFEWLHDHTPLERPLKWYADVWQR